MLHISKGKQRLLSALKMSSHFLLCFLLNLVTCTSSFLVFKVTVQTGSEELVQSLFFTNVRDSSRSTPSRPPQKHSTWSYRSSTFRVGNTSSRDTVRTSYAGFGFCREAPFLGGRRQTCGTLSVEHHSYTAQLIPDKLTDMRYVEVTSWVPECHSVIAVEHTKQSCVLMPAVPVTALSTSCLTYLDATQRMFLAAAKWWLGLMWRSERLYHFSAHRTDIFYYWGKETEFTSYFFNTIKRGTLGKNVIYKIPSSSPGTKTQILSWKGLSETICVQFTEYSIIRQ